MIRYRTLFLDPAWPERGAGKSKRGADRHYDLVPVRDMPALILGSGHWRPAEDAHCYLCATNTHLPSGLWLLEVLGFRYITALTWAKPRFGIGQYFRGQTEHILFGVRGKGLHLRKEHGAPKNLSTLIGSPFGLVPREGSLRHSQKPEAIYELIEAASPGPRIEFFCRSPRPGWAAWGNEIDGGFIPASNRLRAHDETNESSSETA